jgi:hypothetical protein
MYWKPFGFEVSREILPGGYFGVISEVDLDNNVYLQQGLFFSSRGSKYINPTKTRSLTIAPLFLELPINIVKKFNFYKAKIMVYGGVYFGYGMTGYYKYSNWEDGLSIKYGKGNDYDMKVTDLGGNIGLGIEYAHFQFTIQSSHGLSNLAPVTENGEEMRNRNFNLSFAYLFGEKKRIK